MKWLKGRFVYAFAGFREGVFKDKSIMLQFLFALIALVAAFLLKCSKEEWLWILLADFLVIICETFNSCIEKTVDYISLQRHPQAKLIKDMAASAVVLASLFALIVACLIFIPRILEVIS